MITVPTSLHRLMKYSIYSMSDFFSSKLCLWGWSIPYRLLIVIGLLHSIVCPYRNVFMHCTVDGHLGSFQFEVWKVVALEMSVYTSLSEFVHTSLLGIYLGVELLGHSGVLLFVSNCLCLVWNGSIEIGKLMMQKWMDNWRDGVLWVLASKCR